MKPSVGCEMDRGVLRLSFANPPVNALDGVMRRALSDALDAALSDDAVRAIVLIGSGRSFAAGADPSDAQVAPDVPDLDVLCDRIEAAKKPVIAALHGAALGGGLELAMAAHYRVAHPATRLSFPETGLGLVPSAGATQRAPRLLGAARALDLLLSGRTVRAADEAARSMFDMLTSDPLVRVAIAFAERLLAEGNGPRPTRERVEYFADIPAYQATIAARRDVVERRPVLAPREILRCVEAAPFVPFEAGLLIEEDAFQTCLASDQSKALRHAFFAERRVAQIPRGQGDQPHATEVLGIIGARPRTAEVIVAALDARLPVVWFEERGEGAQMQARVSRILDRARSRGRLDDAGLAERLGMLTISPDPAAFAQVDLVIDATSQFDPERVAMSTGVLRESALWGRLGQGQNPFQGRGDGSSAQNPVGLHFLPPAHVKRPVEFVVQPETPPQAKAAIIAFLRRIGKMPVPVGNVAGLVGPRMMASFLRAADEMVIEGTSPYAIDEAMAGWGMAHGPFVEMDLIGINQVLANWRIAQMPEHSFAHALSEAGRLGLAAGQGVYRYVNGRAKTDPDLMPLLQELRARAGRAQASLQGDEIAARLLAAMVNEGARLLRDGAARRASDIDALMIHGFGFPRWRGGPMMAAQHFGLLRLQAILRARAKIDPALWTPDAVLADLIKNGQGFDALNG